jgi:two-component system, chemotaxis family, protein-glutamate methylesterase/glutaminase
VPDDAIVVIGASAGGVEAVSTIVRELPVSLPAAVFVTLHFPATGTSFLPRILARMGRLPVMHPRDGERLERGHIYVAPPACHMMLRRGAIRVARGPRENGMRPAIDPLFRSAAAAYADRVVGVVLTGSLDDGTAGLLAIKRAGGIAIVQDPADALFASMPQSAIEHVSVDHVLPRSEIARAIIDAAAHASRPISSFIARNRRRPRDASPLPPNAATGT